MRRSRKDANPERLRCAIYTRKSSEEGLEQSFNSLHAQREACEAYVASQAGEGWTCLPALYDDGGFSGGTMARPGLERLMADVERGLIDVVVVYKVDRLTRSLVDFARIVEQFDQRKVSFVSVTQAFNTTSSMGRLTLNVLLSFAQFEREVTGERIRDKIALSKQKGMWMGSVPPLGYNVRDHALVVNEAEAGMVRHIFRRYVELGSVHRLRDELEAQEVLSKRWASKAGRTLGGRAISTRVLLDMLRNAHYRGVIVHRDQRYPGRHSAIVDKALFEAAETMLKSHVAKPRGRPAQLAESMLTGKLFDAEGRPMSPSFAYGKGGKAYSYYIALALKQGRRPARESVPRRISAPLLDRSLCERLRQLTGRHDLGAAELRLLIRRVELHARATDVVIAAERLTTDSPACLIHRLKQRLVAGEQAIAEPDGAIRLGLPPVSCLRAGRPWTEDAKKPAAPPLNDGLVEALRSSHRELLELKSSPLTAYRDLAEARPPGTHHRRQLARLPFLAPDLQAIILEGREPAHINLRHLLKTELPLAWSDQRVLFGVPEPAQPARLRAA